MQLGIDLGTTRTVVACADRGNYPVVTFVDAAGDSTPWIPTIAAERRGELRFGFDALAVAEDASWQPVRSFKRLLSSAQAGPGQVVTVGATDLVLADLLTGFLGHVRESLLTRSTIKRSLSRSGGLEAVVAVPANAHGAQRLATLDAFRRAGFEVSAMLNEPSAAGFEYTHRHRDTLSARRDVVVVYDLGGGTFDSSVVRMSGRHHEVLATSGVARLGGDDFDAVLASLVLDRAGLAPESVPERANAVLLEQCRLVKEALHPNTRKITVDLEPVLGRGTPRPECTLPVAEFYEACGPIVARSLEAMQPLMTRVESDAAVGELAGVYVVGGASELPIIARALRERFGRRVHRSPYPSAAVAIGLAIAADGASEYALVDRYSRVFGVYREAQGGQAITFDPIFTPETELPPDAAPLRRTRRYRAAHNVGHYRFFECSALDDDGRPRGDMAIFSDVYFPFDGRLRASGNLATVPIERSGAAGPEVVEQYSLDGKGIVDVLIRDEETGYERSYRLGGA